MRFWVGFVFVVFLAGAMGGAGLMVVPNLVRCDQDWVCALEKTADAIIGSSSVEEEPGVEPISAGCLSESDARGLLAAGHITSLLASSAAEAVTRAEMAYQELSRDSDCVSVSRAVYYLCAEQDQTTGYSTRNICAGFFEGQQGR